MNGLNYVFAAVPSCSAKELLALELPVNPDSCIMASLSQNKWDIKLKTLRKTYKISKQLIPRASYPLIYAYYVHTKNNSIYVYNLLLSLSL